MKMFFGSRSSRRRASGSPPSFLCAAGAGQGSRRESAGGREGGRDGGTEGKRQSGSKRCGEGGGKGESSAESNTFPQSGDLTHGSHTFHSLWPTGPEPGPQYSLGQAEETRGKRERKERDREKKGVKRRRGSTIGT